MESNDSPEISDRGETSDIPGLPSGRKRECVCVCVSECVCERDRKRECVCERVYVCVCVFTELFIFMCDSVQFTFPTFWPIITILKVQYSVITSSDYQVLSQ